MRVTTKFVFNMVTGEVLEHESFEYDGPVALCKGDQTAKQSELLSQQNMQQQMGFSKQLMDVFNKQYADQKAVLDYLKGKVQPMIDNPQGYSPEALAAMRTSATDATSSNYQNAQKTLQAQRFAQGGRDLPSGVDEQLNAALLESEAADKSKAQNDITVQNENLKQGNMWNAINILSGTAAQFNPQSYAGASTGASGAASGAGNTTANLSEAYNASKQSQLMGVLGGIAGGAATGYFSRKN